MHDSKIYINETDVQLAREGILAFMQAKKAWQELRKKEKGDSLGNTSMSTTDIVNRMALEKISWVDPLRKPDGSTSWMGSQKQPRQLNPYRSVGVIVKQAIGELVEEGYIEAEHVREGTVFRYALSEKGRNLAIDVKPYGRPEGHAKPKHSQKKFTMSDLGAILGSDHPAIGTIKAALETSPQGKKDREPGI